MGDLRVVFSQKVKANSLFVTYSSHAAKITKTENQETPQLPPNPRRLLKPSEAKPTSLNAILLWIPVRPSAARDLIDAKLISKGTS